MVSLGVDGITNILILRLLVQYLPIDAAGYWILVTTAGSFLLLLQFGMGPTIARSVAAALATESHSRLPALLGAIRRAFHIIALLVIVVAAMIYGGYLGPTADRSDLEATSALAWFPYAIGLAANLQGQAALFVLNGYGEVGWDKVFRTLFTAGGFIIIWLALRAGADLPTLSLIYLTQHALFWFAASRKMRATLGPASCGAPPQPAQITMLFREGSKLLLLNILTFLVSQFTVFVVERKFGMTEVVSYSAMLRVGILVASVGSLLPQMLYPFVARSWAAGDLARCRRYYLVGVAASVAIALTLCIPLVVYGRDIFTLWLGREVPFSAMTFFAVLTYYLMYVHHGAHAMPVLATAGNAFTLPAIVITISVVALILTLPDHLGLPGVPMSMVFGTALPSAYIVFRAWRLFNSGSRGPEAGQPA